MKLLLDTNVCIAIIKGSPAVRSQLEKAWSNGCEVYFSSIVVFELIYGVARSHPNRKQENAERLRIFLNSPFTVLPFTSEDGAAAAEIRADLVSRGMPIGAYNLLIAGQAPSNGLTVITANESEFARVKGLMWENWSKPN